MEREKMNKLIILPIVLLVLSGCNTTSYLTKEGGRLAGNSAAGCILGQIFADNCAAGAAVGAAATVIDDQTN